MRPDIDLHVMQEMGAMIRADCPAPEPLSLDISVLLDTLRIASPNG